MFLTGGHLIVRPAIKRPARLLLAYPAPLFEEEWDVCPLTTIPDIEDPLTPHRPGLWATFPTNNDPGNAREVQVVDWTEQGLDRQNSRRDGSLLQMPNPGGCGPVLNGHAAPDMRRDRAGSISTSDIPPQPRAAFGQDLKHMPVCRFHRVEHAVDEFHRNALVEQIAHRIHEDHARSFPREWLGEAFGTERDIEPTSEWMTGHAAEALGEPFGVTMIAAPRDLGAARHGVPGGVGPLDPGFIAHTYDSLYDVFGSDYI